MTETTQVAETQVLFEPVRSALKDLPVIERKRFGG